MLIREIKMEKIFHLSNQGAPGRLDSERLKTIVREGLITMHPPEREQVVLDLEAEMNRAGSTMRSYLIPLGIPGTSAGELTPNEVGHLIRFLTVAAPELMPAVERVLSRYSAFSPGEGLPGCRAA